MARLLDLFCGAGGCSVGYSRAGFLVVGVDIEPQPRYPFPFEQRDALEALLCLQAGGPVCGLRLHDIDVIHASPPCQAYSVTRHLPNVTALHPDLLPRTREILQATGRPWVIENVDGVPLQPPAVMLCGLMFNLRLFRHRWFESSELLLIPDHEPHRQRRIGQNGYVCMAGHGSARSGGRLTVPPDHRSVASWRAAFGIDWMTRDELSQAIPPAYTEYLGRQLLRALEVD